MAIDRFEGKYTFLSNFYMDMHPIEYMGTFYPTAEHAYQAAKAITPAQHSAVLRAATPARAKRIGQIVTCRPDWEQVKDGIMLEILRAKFKVRYMTDKLLATGDEELIEGNWWGDTYWGVCKGKGKNMLGKLLMQVRQELKEKL